MLLQATFFEVLFYEVLRNQYRCPGMEMLFWSVLSSTDLYFYLLLYPRGLTQTIAVNTLDFPLTSKRGWLLGSPCRRLERGKVEVSVLVTQVPALRGCLGLFVS